MLSIVKNQATAALRVGFPIIVYDDDGEFDITNLTFAHGSAVAGVTGVAKEVEVWNGTDWVEAAANPTEIKGVTGTASGQFQYQFTQAETNVNTFIAVRLCKTGMLRPFPLYVPIVALASASSSDIDYISSELLDLKQLTSAQPPSSALHAFASSVTVVTGLNGGGSVANTQTDNSSSQSLNPANPTGLEAYFEFTLASATDVATEALLSANLFSTNADERLFVRAYNYTSLAWDTIGSLYVTDPDSTIGKQYTSYPLLPAYTSAGVVRIGFYSTTWASATGALDVYRILTSYVPTMATAAALTTAQADITRMLGLLHENSLDDNHAYSSSKLTSCRKRVFASAAACAAATIGAANGADSEIARYTLTFTYSGDDLASFKWVRDL